MRRLICSFAVRIWQKTSLIDSRNFSCCTFILQNTQNTWKNKMYSNWLFSLFQKCLLLINLTKIIEPEHNKTNKITSVLSEDFAVHLKKVWVFGYPKSAQRRLIRMGDCPGWSESLLGTLVILLGFVMLLFDFSFLFSFLWEVHVCLSH